MKNRLFILLAIIVFWACSDNTEQQEPLSAGKAIELLPLKTKATVNYDLDEYFGLESQNGVTVKIKSGDALTQSIYIYKNDKLTAAHDTLLLWFPYDGAQIDTLTVLWPVESKWNEIPLDQSTREAFLGADWLKAELLNIGQTTSLIPISFNHEHSKVTFTLTGSHAGAKIDSLTFQGFTAYCDKSATILDAQIIINPAIHAAYFAGGSNLRGTVKIANDDSIHDFVLATMPELDTEASHNYTIMLNLD